MTCRRLRGIPVCLLLVGIGFVNAALLSGGPLLAEDPEIRIETPLSPPAWALLERELLKANAAACEEFYDRYFDDRGWLECVERWGGDDGPDDAIECVNHWPILHALGARDEVLHLYKRAWEGHLRQYTQAKTTVVPFARDGMYYKEFPVMFDWLHNGEGLTVFNLQGLSDPDDAKFQQRVRRFAGFYLNEDPQAPNYDPEHKLIRSLFNGSRGPLLRPATALDWAGDPIEVAGRFKLGHGEENYEQMLEHFEEYTDIVGDHPSNLAATSLAMNAYMLTGEAKYKDWLLEYVDAWSERAARNGGILPSKIGLDGTIGGAGGKWYDGVYGWGFTVKVPQDGALSHRSTVRIGIVGFLNAYALTGDDKYLDVWRKQIATINAQAKTVDGKPVYPQMYGDDGWYHFTAEPYRHGGLDVAYLSMRPADRTVLGKHNWFEFLDGRQSNYPEESLRRDLALVRAKVARFREDQTTPDTRLADDPLVLNPATVESLVELMLGGIHPGRVGSILHCRLRYFDPEERRAGIPEDVAALVEKLTADSVTVSLVNTNQLEPRTVLIQAGGYGEHQFTSGTCEGQTVPMDARHLRIRLAPGAGGQLTLSMKRFVNQPTMRFPGSL